MGFNKGCIGCDCWRLGNTLFDTPSKINFFDFTPISPSQNRPACFRKPGGVIPARNFSENPPEILKQAGVKFVVLVQRFSGALSAFTGEQGENFFQVHLRGLCLRTHRGDDRRGLFFERADSRIFVRVCDRRPALIK